MQCVLRFKESNSPIAVQRNFRRLLWRQPPSIYIPSNDGIIYKNSTTAGSAADLKWSGRPKQITDEVAEAIGQCYTCSPRKSIRRTWREIGLPRSALNKKSCVSDLMFMHTSFTSYSRSNKMITNTVLTMNLIGLSNPTAWPPRSLGITPMDFFYVTDIVYPGSLSLT